MSETEITEGGCMCGQVRYRATGKPYKVAYCHCDSCRKAIAAPVSAWVMYYENQLEFIGKNPTLYPSSAGVLRSFCPTCGTSLSWAGSWDDRGIAMVTLCSLDDPNKYVPDRHSSCDNRLPWFDTADHFPRYQKGSPVGE